MAKHLVRDSPPSVVFVVVYAVLRIWQHCPTMWTSSSRSATSIARARHAGWRSVRFPRAVQAQPDPMLDVGLTAAVAVDLRLGGSADLVDRSAAETSHKL